MVADGLEKIKKLVVSNINFKLYFDILSYQSFFELLLIVIR